MDDAKIAELKARHGNSELTLITFGKHELVVKKPTRAQFNRFREGVANGGRAHIDAGAQLITDTLVYPTWAEYLTLAEESPNVEDEVTREVCMLAKAYDKVETKKL